MKDNIIGELDPDADDYSEKLLEIQSDLDLEQSNQIQ